MINHFVKRERMAGCDIIFIFERREPHGLAKRNGPRHPDRIYRGRPFTDHGSWIAADNRDV